ncbi:putative DCC family thiol-disulfide oxidoreductase YuxK [Cytobacillus eiseniae]|uniref:DCC family thiol-disulfide oxidoreductase YuxK n=2 Tax=Cytobacillus eiseniae TaxID=762947 RepID=A0ABS4RKA1_9BACI|nr:putative DCC family thiol-disulfide oxidoreductase YuxK [Cytobacillus eiseniae]
MFQKLDWLEKVEWISLQEYEKGEHTHIFDKESLRKELHLITPTGKVLKGYYAIRYLFLLFPASCLIGLIGYIPLSPIIGKPIYKWVAKNRHRWTKGKCKDGSCSL